MNMLAQMSWGEWALAWLLIVVCCVLMFIILLQRGRGGGLSAAFGGGGGSAAFGAKTGDVLTWITVVGASVFVLLAVVANYAFDKSPPPVRQAPLATTSTTGPEAPTDQDQAPSITVTPIEGEPGEAQVPADSEEPSDETGAVQEEEDAASEEESPASADGPAPAPEESQGQETGDEAAEPDHSGAEEQPGP